MKAPNNSSAELTLDELTCAADCLRVMAHPLRLRMVELLLQESRTVQDIADLCNLPHHQACEHLRLMKGHGFLDSERRGRKVYYTIRSPRLPGLLSCIRESCGRD